MQKHQSLIVVLLVFIMFFLSFSPAFALTNPHPLNFLPLSFRSENISDTLIFSTDSSDYELVNHDNTASIQVHGYDHMNVPGKPQIWFKEVILPIPDHYKFDTIELTFTKTIPIESPMGSWCCSPQPHVMSIDRKGEENSQILLDSCDSFPDSSQMLSPYPYNSYRILTDPTADHPVTLQLFPILYVNDHQAEWIEEFTFQVSYTSSDVIQVHTSPQSSNPDGVGIIIAPDSFQEAAYILQKHQRANHVESDIVWLNEISQQALLIPTLPESIQGYEDFHPAYLNSYDATLAYQIRNYIFERYTSPEKTIQYVTVIGDASHIPPSYYVFSKDSEYDYEKWIPTDLFYTQFDTDWSTLQSSLAFGRIPCSNADEAVQMVNNIAKQIEVPRNAPMPTLLSGGDPFENDRYFAELVQAKHLNQSLFPSTEVEKQFATSENCTTDQLIQRLQDHSYPFVWAFGHGDGSSLLLDDGEIDSNSILNWDFDYQHGLMISEGCGNASYDQQLLGFKNEPSIGASLLLSKSGFQSYFGSTRDCWCGWDYKCNKGIPTVKSVFYGESLIQYFLEAMNTSSSTLGIAVSKAFQSYALLDQFSINEPYLKTLFGFAYLGDPTTPNPFFQKTTSSQNVEFEKNNQVGCDIDDIPVFSLHEEMQLEVLSTSPYIRLILYRTDEDQMILDQIYSPTLRRDKGAHYYQLCIQIPHKGEYVARIESENGQEQRLYFDSKKEHDLVLTPSLDLLLLSKGKKKDYTIQIHNEGYLEEENVVVSVVEKNQIIFKKEFSTIPPYSSRQAYFSYFSLEEGEKQLEFSISTASQRLSQVKTLHVSSQPITRIGILCSNTLDHQKEIQQQLMLEDINKDLSRRLFNIELQAVPFAPDHNGQTSFDRLEFDIIMLFAQPEKTPHQSELLHRLVEFEKKGGLIIGMIPFGYGKSDPQVNTLLQSFFGIDEKEKLAIVQTNNKEDKLYIQDKRWLQSFRREYRLRTPFNLSTLKPSWKEAKLLNEAVLVGTSPINDNACIEYKNRILFTGFLNTDCFNSLDDSYTFFLDFLQFAKNCYIQKQASFSSSVDIKSPSDVTKNSKSYAQGLNDYIAKEPIFPSSSQVYNDTIWIATINGFYKSTLQNPTEFSFSPYPPDLIETIGPEWFKEQLSIPSRNRFRLYQDQVVFYGNEAFYVFHPEKSQKLLTIPNVVYETFVIPLQQFSDVIDFEIYNHHLYVLDRQNQITVIDIRTGKKIFTFPDSQQNRTDLDFYHDQLHVLTKEHQITVFDSFGAYRSSISLPTHHQFHSFHISDDGMIYIAISDERHSFYEIPVYVSSSGSTTRLKKSFSISNAQLGDIEQFFVCKNLFIGLFACSNTTDLLSFKGIWLAFDLIGKNTIYATSLEKEYYTNIHHTLFSSDCWVTKNGTVVMKQQKPLRHIVDIYSPEHFYWQGSIVITDYAPGYSLVDFSFHPTEEWIYAVFQKDSQLLLVTLDPIQPNRWHKLELPVSNPSTVQSFSLFQNMLFFVHSNGRIEIVDINQRKIMQEFYPSSKLKENYALSTSQVLADQKYIYVVDGRGNQILGFTYTGDFLFCHSLQSLIPDTYSKAVLLQNSEIALLHQKNKTIQLFGQGKFTKQYSLEKMYPLSFQATKNTFFIIDYYSGILTYSR
ncbi:MAG TPA: C25 family cysteine peptidase [Caldisericia bacterium]|nr:C25 family cysteine peptidase [Caldisericia bacterium]